MEEKFLKLKIIHESWGERCEGMWKSTTWKVYNDLSLDIIDSYGNKEENNKYFYRRLRQKFI